MVSKKVVVTNEHGFHLRPAADFCNSTLHFDCDVKVVKRDKVRDGKSLLSLLSAGVNQGDEIEIRCDGSDEEKALSFLIDFVENHMGKEKEK